MPTTSASDGNGTWLGEGAIEVGVALVMLFACSMSILAIHQAADVQREFTALQKLQHLPVEDRPSRVPLVLFCILLAACIGVLVVLGINEYHDKSMLTYLGLAKARE